MRTEKFKSCEQKNIFMALETMRLSSSLLLKGTPTALSKHREKRGPGARTYLCAALLSLPLRAALSLFRFSVQLLPFRSFPATGCPSSFFFLLSDLSPLRPPLHLAGRLSSDPANARSMDLSTQSLDLKQKKSELEDEVSKDQRRRESARAEGKP